MRILLTSILTVTFYLNSNSQQVEKDLSAFYKIALEKNHSGPKSLLFNDVNPESIFQLKDRFQKTNGLLQVHYITEDGEDSIDQISLDKREMLEVLNKIEELKNFQWTEENSHLLGFESLRLISRDTIGDHWDALPKFQILPPVFFKDNQYGLFFYDINCSGLCGELYFIIYRKSAEHWKFWKLLWGFVS